jgi:hypothetical protein
MKGSSRRIHGEFMGLAVDFGMSDQDGRVRIPIVGLPCVAGDRLPLERALASLRGVAEAYVNAGDESVYLEVDASQFRTEEALSVLERFGARAVGPAIRVR